MTTINIGIIGYGMSTTVFHIPTISAVPGCKVHAVVQRAGPPAQGSNPKRDEHVTSDFPDIKHHQSTDELFADPDIHLVVVATPSPGHYDLAKKALEAGKHVLVEKPFTPSSPLATSLITLAAQKRLLLTTYHNRRLDSDFLTLKSLLSPSSPTSTLLSPIVTLTSQFNRYRPEVSTAKAWKNSPTPGTGNLFDLGSHLIDQVLQLFGMPDWLWAHLDNQRQSDPLSVDDFFVLHLYYKAREGWNGGKPLMVELRAGVVSAVAPEKQMRYLVKGWKGTWQKFGTDGQEEQLKLGGVDAVGKEGFAEEANGEEGFLTVVEDEVGVLGGVLDRGEKRGGFATGKVKGKKGDYVGFYENLVGCVRRAVEGEDVETVKRDLLVKAEEARDVIRIIELAMASSETGERVTVTKAGMGYDGAGYEIRN